MLTLVKNMTKRTPVARTAYLAKPAIYIINYMKICGRTEELQSLKDLVASFPGFETLLQFVKPSWPCFIGVGFYMAPFRNPNGSRTKRCRPSRPAMGMKGFQHLGYI